MSIKRKNLTIIIVSYKSNHIIHNCLNSIDKDIKIIVIDNSNDRSFKKNLEMKYKNVYCITSSKNLGMGAGNNLGIKIAKTDFALIINPDVVLNNSTINELMNAINNLKDFAVISPISSKPKNPNYKLGKNHCYDKIHPFEVKSIDGYAMLFNLKKLKNLEGFNFFDENYFLYLENDDLCKELKNRNEKIYIIPKSKIEHFGASAVDPIYQKEIELSRNWHWMWSKFYFNKKHYGYLNAVNKIYKNLLSALIKYFYFLITFNINKKKIYQMRLNGLLNSMLGRKSFHRPNLDI
jgi:N-acetylglucosaminyl-diphospho-decaprenol L-rhamnosyltransferase